MSDRTYGVEIECGHPTNSDGVRGLLAADAKLPAGWSVCCDGSGVEVRTPVLRGDKGFETLSKMMNLLRDTGGYTTRSDGMHCHFGAEDYIKGPKEALIRVMESWVNNEAIIQKFVHPYRCKSPMCKKSFTNSSVEYAKNQDGGIPGGQGALTLSNVVTCRTAFKATGRFSTAQPTFEVRLHEGTLDAYEATGWITMLRAFLDQCWENVIPPHKKVETFLDALGIESDARAALIAKAETREERRFGNCPYDPDAKTKKGYWWCAYYSGAQNYNGCSDWHKDGEPCPKGERDEYCQDGFHGKHTSAGGV